MPPDPGELLSVTQLIIPAISLVLGGALLWAEPPWGFRAPDRPREPALWGWAEIALILAAWCLIQIFLATAILPLVEEERLSWAAGFAIIQTVGAAAAIGLLLGVVRRTAGQTVRVLGVAPTAASNLLPMVLLWFLSLAPIGALHAAWSFLLRALFDYRPEAQDLLLKYQTSIGEGSWPSAVVIVLCGVLIAPTVEEFVFRGFVHGGLRVRCGPVAGTVLSGLLFGAVHFHAGAFLPLAALGCLLAVLYDRTGSLLVPTIFHAAFNGATFLAHAAP